MDRASPSGDDASVAVGRALTPNQQPRSPARGLRRTLLAPNYLKSARSRLIVVIRLSHGACPRWMMARRMLWTTFRRLSIGPHSLLIAPGTLRVECWNLLGARCRVRIAPSSWLNPPCRLRSAFRLRVGLRNSQEALPTAAVALRALWIASPDLRIARPDLRIARPDWRIASSSLAIGRPGADIGSAQTANESPQRRFTAA
jgi:hypothetical protein